MLKMIDMGVYDIYKAIYTCFFCVKYGYISSPVTYQLIFTHQNTHAGSPLSWREKNVQIDKVVHGKSSTFMGHTEEASTYKHEQDSEEANVSPSAFLKNILHKKVTSRPRGQWFHPYSELSSARNMERSQESQDCYSRLQCWGLRLKFPIIEFSALGHNLSREHRNASEN